MMGMRHLSAGAAVVCVDAVARDARAEVARVGAAGADWSVVVSGRAWKSGVGRAACAFRDRGTAGGDAADVDRGAGAREGNRAQVQLAVQSRDWRLGFVGVAVLFGPDILRHGGEVNLLGAFAVLFGTFIWAAGTIWMRSVKMPDSPVISSAMQMLGGGVALMIAAALTRETAGFHLTQCRSGRGWHWRIWRCSDRSSRSRRTAGCTWWRRLRGWRRTRM